MHISVRSSFNLIFTVIILKARHIDRRKIKMQMSRSVCIFHQNQFFSTQTEFLLRIDAGMVDPISWFIRINKSHIERMDGSQFGSLK